MTKMAAGLCMGCMRPLTGPQVCPHCGYTYNAGYDPNFIKPGSTLCARYIVGRLEHKNGECAEYIGFDTNTATPVWIHEYFPGNIATRNMASGAVIPKQGLGAQYKALLSDFLDICNEVKRLSASEPVVEVEHVFSENNTAYAIILKEELVPLETWLARQGGSLPPDECREMFVPLLNTLSNIHAHGQIHRGISPYTVYVDRQGRLRLGNFALGATRTANSELESELFSGYSAPEQYASNGWQGTWTDVYAAAALLYRTLSGVVPPKSTLVGQSRPVTPLADLVMGLPKNISDAIADAMRVPTEHRTQAIATLTSQLIQARGSSTAIYDTSRVGGGRRKKPAGYREKPEEKDRRSTAKYVILALGLTVVLLLGFIMIFMRSYYPDLLGTGGQNTSEVSAEGDISGDDGVQGEDGVPRFIGQQASDVTADVQYEEKYEFSLKEEYNDIYPEGVIFGQLPEEGTMMPEKGVVILNVSKGPEKLELPQLVGESLEDALITLKDLDESKELRVEIFERHDATAKPGTVIRTIPEAGEEIDPKKQAVYLFVVPQKSAPEEKSSSESASSTPSRNEDEESSRPFFFHD